MNNSKYAVVVTYSFDPQVSVLLFNTQEEAMDFIKKDIDEEYHGDLVNGFDSEMTIYESENRAVLIAHGENKELITERRIGTVYDQWRDDWDI
jgi:hypothetical protein